VTQCSWLIKIAHCTAAVHFTQNRCSANLIYFNKHAQARTQKKLTGRHRHLCSWMVEVYKELSWIRICV